VLVFYVTRLSVDPAESKKGIRRFCPDLADGNVHLSSVLLEVLRITAKSPEGMSEQVTSRDRQNTGQGLPFQALCSLVSLIQFNWRRLLSGRKAL
jgi:hypothetical protein